MYYIFAQAHFCFRTTKSPSGIRNISNILSSITLPIVKISGNYNFVRKKGEVGARVQSSSHNTLADKLITNKILTIIYLF